MSMKAVVTVSNIKMVEKNGNKTLEKLHNRLGTEIQNKLVNVYWYRREDKEYHSRLETRLLLLGFTYRKHAFL